jgi:glutamine synthetase
MAEKKDFLSLKNPIEVSTNKNKNDLTREDLLNVIIEHEIERITFHYTGIDGKIKELKIPVTSKRHAEQILTDGERVDGSSLFKGLVEVGKSDLYVVPVYKSAFFNPFEKGSLDFMCKFVDRDGKLAGFAPDNILTNAQNLLKKNHGMQLLAHGEVEFYLLKDSDNDTYVLPAQRGYHASSPFAKSGAVVDEMLRILARITGSVKYAHNEVGYIHRIESEYPELNGKSAEQVEIEFSLSDVEEAANNIILAAWIIRNVAYRNGMVATFFPKIEPGQAGTGFHIHMALSKDNRNIMCDKSGELSEDALKLIGGLCKYAPSLTSFGNTVSASYLRLVPGQEAPTKVFWSDSNRSALIRVPLAWTKVSNLTKIVNPQQKTDSEIDDVRQTVELRSPDGSANVHLLLAGITMAVDWGLVNTDKSLPLARKSRITSTVDMSADVDVLMRSCVESAELLLAKRAHYERENIFPPAVIDYVGDLLKRENDRNLNSRLLAMAEDERLKESRRIMHRDIHRC